MTMNDKITEYLSAGGLINPELMDHDKVRNLLIECRQRIFDLENKWIDSVADAAKAKGRNDTLLSVIESYATSDAEQRSQIRRLRYALMNMLDDGDKTDREFILNVLEETQ
jgi:hypothetical protein